MGLDGWMDGKNRWMDRHGFLGAKGWARMDGSEMMDGWMDRRGWTDADKQMVWRTQTDGQAQLDDYQVCIGSYL